MAFHRGGERFLLLQTRALKAETHPPGTGVLWWDRLAGGVD